MHTPWLGLRTFPRALFQRLHSFPALGTSCIYFLFEMIGLLCYLAAFLWLTRLDTFSSSLWCGCDRITVSFSEMRPFEWQVPLNCHHGRRVGSLPVCDTIVVWLLYLSVNCVCLIDRCRSTVTMAGELAQYVFVTRAGRQEQITFPRENWGLSMIGAMWRSRRQNTRIKEFFCSLYPLSFDLKQQPS